MEKLFLFSKSFVQHCAQGYCILATLIGIVIALTWSALAYGNATGRVGVTTQMNCNQSGCHASPRNASATVSIQIMSSPGVISTASKVINASPATFNIVLAFPQTSSFTVGDTSFGGGFNLWNQNTSATLGVMSGITDVNATSQTTSGSMARRSGVAELTHAQRKGTTISGSTHTVTWNGLRWMAGAALTSAGSGSDTLSIVAMVVDANGVQTSDSVFVSASENIIYNARPTVRAVTVRTTQNQSVTFSLSGTDVGNTTLTASVTNPSNGMLTATGGQYRYMPNANYTGADDIQYSVSDGVSRSTTATVSITVVAPPTTPTPSSPTSSSSSGCSFAPASVGASSAPLLLLLPFIVALCRRGRQHK